MHRIIPILLLLLVPISIHAQRFGRVVNNIAALAASNPNNVDTNVLVVGFSTTNDNGGGIFSWIPGDASTLHAGLVVSSTFPGATGRYKRQFTGPVNAAWIGTPRDNINDASVAINDGIAYLDETGGGELFVPRGTYRVSAPILPRSNQKLTLEDGVIMDSGTPTNILSMIFPDTSTGNKTNITVGSTGRAILRSTTNTAFQVYGIALNCQNTGDVLRDIRIENITCQSFGTDGFACSGNVGDFPEYVLVKNCVFQKNKRHGASVGQGRHIKFEDCQFLDNTGQTFSDGIDCEPDITLAWYDISFTRCRFAGNVNHGLYAQTGLGVEAVGLTVTDCIFENNGGVGLNITKVSKFNVTGGRSSTNGLHGAFISTSKDGTLQGGQYFNSTTRSGIEVVWSQGVNVIAPSCFINTQDGIRLTGGGSATQQLEKIKVIGAYCYSNTLAGISGAGLNASGIGGNTLFQNGQQGILLTGSSGNELIGNEVMENSQANDLGAANIHLELNSANNNLIGNIIRKALRYTTGTAQAGSGSSITLSVNASSTDHYYEGQTVRTLSGTGSGQTQIIVTYDGTTKIATVSAFAPAPNNTSVYEITGTKRPSDGIRINNSNCVNNDIRNNNVWNAGQVNEVFDGGTATVRYLPVSEGGTSTNDLAKLSGNIGTISGDFIIENNHFYKVKDNVGTPQQAVGMDASNNTLLTSGAGGDVKLRPGADDTISFEVGADGKVIYRGFATTNSILYANASKRLDPVTLGSMFSSPFVGTLNVLDNTMQQKIGILKNGALVGTRKAANFVEGSGVTMTITDDAGNDRINATIAVSGGGSATNAYNLVQDEGTPLAQRTTMNFTGAGVTASDSGGITVVNIPGGGGAGNAPTNTLVSLSTPSTAGGLWYANDTIGTNATAATGLTVTSGINLGISGNLTGGGTNVWGALAVKQASFTTGLGVTNVSNVLSNNSVAGTGITITAGSNGQLTFTSTSQPAFTTGAGVTNISNVLSADLAAGSNITFTTNANGQISIAASGGGSGGNTSLFNFQKVGSGTDFTYSLGSGVYEKVSFGTSGPSIVLTNAGTYQIILTVGAHANNTFAQGFWLTNITDHTDVVGSHHTINVSSRESPTPLDFIYTTSAANKTLELWGETDDPGVPPTNAHVLAANTVADVLLLADAGNTNGIVSLNGLTPSTQTFATAGTADTLTITSIGSTHTFDVKPKVSRAGDTMTGTLTVTGLTNSALTANRAVISAADKSLASSNTTDTEISYVNGVTSAIQTQLNGKQASGNYITALTGDVTATGPGSVAATIANNAVTYAKMQDVTATSRAIGRNTAGAGDPEEVTMSQILDWVGSAAQGDILYRGASVWARLGAGTSGQFLQTQGAGANPLWATAGGGGGIAGTVINTGTPTIYDIPYYTDTSGTNIAPSVHSYDGHALKLGHDAASPQAQTIIASGPRGGTDSNVAGSNITIAGSPGTGTGNGGNIILGVSPAGSTGTTTNASVTALTLAIDAQSTNTIATTIAGRLRVADGTAALPSVVFASDDDATGTGFYRAAANQVGFTANGILEALFYSAGIEMTTGTYLEWGANTYLTRDANATLQMGQDAAAPIAQTFKGPDGSGTDKISGAMTLATGKSTGTGKPSDFSIQSSIKGTSTGSTAQSLGNRWLAIGNPINLTDATATLVGNITVASGKYATVTLDVASYATDGTDYQTRHDVIEFTANNKAGTVSINGPNTISSNAQTTTGTLTTTWTVVANGNAVDIKDNADTSFGSTTLFTAKITAMSINSNDPATWTDQ